MVILSVTENEKNSPKIRVDDIKSDGIDRKNMGKYTGCPRKKELNDYSELDNLNNYI